MNQVALYKEKDDKKRKNKKYSLKDKLIGLDLDLEVLFWSFFFAQLC